MQATSLDGSTIHYDITGSGDTALVFVHGWMGNGTWWDAQRGFSGTHQIVQMDLAGHGRSTKTRAAWTAAAYAADIVAVTRELAAKHIVLVGHSMSGAYVVLAAPEVSKLSMVVLVDTLKNLDAPRSDAEIDGMLALYRSDYANTLATILPRFLFAPGTPALVRERLMREFGTVTGDTAAKLVEPLYRIDLRDAARLVRVPVRGIDTDLHPSDVVANRRYFADYALTTIAGYGHYPMLEAPEAFNAALATLL